MIKTSLITMSNVNLYFVGSDEDIKNISDVILKQKAPEPLDFMELVHRVLNSRTLHCFVQSNSLRTSFDVMNLNKLFKAGGRGLSITQFSEALAFERPDLAMKALGLNENQLEERKKVCKWAEMEF